MNKYKLTRKEVIECMEDYGVLEWNPEIYGILVNSLLAKKEPKREKFKSFNDCLDYVCDEPKESWMCDACGIDHLAKAHEMVDKEKCLHDHLCCPGDIRTVRCAYCGKSMYQEPEESREWLPKENGFTTWEKIPQEEPQKIEELDIMPLHKTDLHLALKINEIIGFINLLNNK